MTCEPSQSLQNRDKLSNYFPEHCYSDSYEYEQGVTSNIVVPGSLKNHIQFWRSIGSSQFILDVIDEGYRIPFYSTPPPSFSRNNKSALAHRSFVDEAISELLLTYRVFETDVIPRNVNPLSVSIQSSGKKRLILDLRLINKHLWKKSVKFEDLRVALNYLEKGHFMFSFDIQSGYHHVLIFPPHQSFLGFSWFYKGKTRYFCFRVLPFGLSSAPYIFTKLFRPLVAYWRRQGIHIVVYLDDGLGEAPSYQVALDHSTKVKSDLVRSGFVPNSEKSIWVPTLVIDWLGFTIDLFQGLLFIPGKKIKRVLSDITSILEANCSSARDLSALAGRINSFHLAVGNATTLMTKFLHMSIVLQSSWDSKFLLPPSVKEELVFWKDNVRCLNGRPIGRQFSGTRTIVYSDASDVGAGGVIKGRDGVICHLPWSPDEARRSSTWRELQAVHVCLSSFSKTLTGCAVQWFTDNRNIPSIIRSGSMKSDLHQLALSIFEILIRNSIDLQVDWIPRSFNDHADAISRIIDFDDWGVSLEFFNYIDHIWGPHTVDCFANFNNRKLTRFYSRYWNPDAEGVDAFCHDWAGENNWLVPPVFLVPRVIRHLAECKAEGTLIVPEWVSSPFWPMLFGPQSLYSSFVRCTIIFSDVSGVFVRGSTDSIFDGPKFKSRVLAVRLSGR